MTVAYIFFPSAEFAYGNVGALISKDQKVNLIIGGENFAPKNFVNLPYNRNSLCLTV